MIMGRPLAALREWAEAGSLPAGSPPLVPRSGSGVPGRVERATEPERSGGEQLWSEPPSGSGAEARAEQQ